MLVCTCTCTCAVHVHTYRGNITDWEWEQWKERFGVAVVSVEEGSGVE